MGKGKRKSKLEKLKNTYLKVYQSYNKVFCPVLNEYVYFSDTGWFHIIKNSRTDKEIKTRVQCIPLAKKLIESAKKCHKGKAGQDITFRLDGKVEGKDINVIIYKIKSKFEFVSVYELYDNIYSF